MEQQDGFDEKGCFKDVNPLCWLAPLNYPLVRPHGDMMAGIAEMVRSSEEYQ